MFPITKNQTAMRLNQTFTLLPLTLNSSLPPTTFHFQSEASSSSLPKFNSDNRHYTPAFIVPADTSLLSRNTEFERFRFQERIHNTNQKELEEGLAQPEDNYCQVCRESFMQYDEHIASAQHRTASSKSFANDYIREIIEQIAPKRKAICRRRGLCEPVCHASQSIASRLTRRMAPGRPKVKASHSTALPSSQF